MGQGWGSHLAPGRNAVRRGEQASGAWLLRNQTTRLMQACWCDWHAILRGSLALWVILLAALAAQGTPPTGPVFTNDRKVIIPIHCAQPELVERLQVYVSPNQGEQWHLYASVPPTQQEVVFHAPGDGVYWFDLVVHHRNGLVEPSAPGKRPPLVVLYVDTKPPRVSLRPVACSPGEAGVQWEVEDEHLDLRTLILEYRDPHSGAWTSVPVIPTVARGERRWPVPPGGQVLVRLRVADLAENVAQAQVEVAVHPGTSAGIQPATSLAPNAGNPLLPAGSTNAVVPPPPPPPSLNHLTQPTPLPPAPSVPPQGVQQSSAAPTTSPSSNAPPMTSAQPSPTPAGPLPASPAGNQPPAPLPAETTGPRVIARSESSGLPTTLVSWERQGPTNGSGGPMPPRGAVPNVRYLNSLKASVQYEVSRVGPSGVGSVELWMTRDDGRTWFKAADDPDLQPPLLVEFPGEGIYGLTLVVRSRVGLGRAAPQPGEPPQWRVEVDITPPYAELYAVEADPHRRDFLVFLWSATDKNLAANPITLKWAERESGPWHVIAAELPNTGRHVWKMPDHLPHMVYLRLEVRDLAGNLAVAQTPKPVLVDLQEPEIKLLDITPPTPIP
ncbi:MAG: hypothetical protein RMI91_02390 [Gemmatales bacterium]|nr:hypothetical protein [Gemmatales bacterium]MDW7993477.1 hypothetical protein [Gemmatales bacterium]